MSGCVSERGLDLGRVDVHAARDDHVLLAVADEEEALVVAVGDVADGVEVAPHVGLVLVVLLVVVGEDAGRPHEQLARVVGPDAGDLVAVVVEQPHLDAGRGLAARAGLAQLVGRLEDAVHARARSSRTPRTASRPGSRAGTSASGRSSRARRWRSCASSTTVVAGLHVLGQRADHADRRRRRERGRSPGTSRPAAASPRVELALHDDGLAEGLGDAHEAAGAGVVERPGGEVHVVGRCSR